MRLWSIHPVYLDKVGLVSLWRESLLAQKVLQGKTKGYKNHPQLTRFKNTVDPIGTIANYLQAIFNEAENRGYKFDKTKIVKRKCKEIFFVTNRQLEYEFNHLLNKLEKRNPKLYIQLSKVKTIKPHPIFNKIDGDIAEWEVL
jgi:hypothetical protein